MKAPLIASILAVLVAAAPAARADEAQISRDIRCFSLLGPLSNRMIRDSNPRVRMQGSKAIQLASYYLGRVDAIVPPAELADRIRREISTLKEADARAETARCQKEIQAIEARFDALGAALKPSEAN